MALTRAEVVDAALGILDEYGLADLSMRRVAARLEVQPGALYHHVENKQTLLAGVADEILGQVSCPAGPWREAILGWALNLRAALMAHRDSAEVVASSRAFGLVTVDVLERPILMLAAAGIPEPTARQAASTLWHFVLGHVAEEQARRYLVQMNLAASESPGRSASGSSPEVSDEEQLRGGVGLILSGASAALA